VAFGSLSVKGRALRHLSQREHSRAELARKLARKVEDTEDATAGQQIDAALNELTAHGLLSETRAAESLLNGRGQRFGERRLKQTLQARGFAPELVASTLAQARGSEFERAREVWRRKFDAPPQDAMQRGKQMRFLLGRGFSGAIVSRVLRECGSSDNDSDSHNDSDSDDSSETDDGRESTKA
jgi:regulatory protein